MNLFRFEVYGSGPDAAPIYASLVEALAKLYCHAFPTAEELSARQMLWREFAGGDRYILAFSDHQLVGFVSWRMRGGPTHQSAELYHIGRDLQNLRSRGIGRRLIMEMEKDLQRVYRKAGLPGVRKVCIYTHDSNAAAHALYQRAGYGHETTLKNLLHDGVDEYIFTKEWPEHVVPKPP